MKKVRLVKLPGLLYTIMLLVMSSYLLTLLYFNIVQLLLYNYSYTADFFAASSGAEKQTDTSSSRLARGGGAGAGEYRFTIYLAILLRFVVSNGFSFERGRTNCVHSNGKTLLINTTLVSVTGDIMTCCGISEECKCSESILLLN